jgi:hypothetical protein
MEPTDLHQTIAFQIDNQRPAHLVPGKHVGMEVVDADSLRVIVLPTGIRAVVTYQHGPDLYAVSVTNHAGEVTMFDGVYCDMLGDLIFGVNAEPATYPMVELVVLDPETGEVVEVTEL